MQLNIESPHFRSAKLETRIQLKFQRLTKIYDQVEDTSLVLRSVNDAKNRNCEIEAKLLVPGKTLFAIAQAETFAEALDKVVNVLRSQLRKHKEALKQTRHNPYSFAV